MIHKILSYIPGLRLLLLPSRIDVPKEFAQFEKQQKTSSGSRDSFGNFYTKKGGYSGHKALNGMFKDKKGDYQGKINSDGTFHDRFGHYVGRINRHGHLSGKDGNFLGRLSKAGAVIGKNGQYLGQVPPGHEAAAFHLVFAQNQEKEAKIIPLLGIAAWSGTGKTTLLKQLIPLLNAENMKIGLIKHTHHKMDVDTKGKDSYELRKAGANPTLIASSARWALMTETPEGQMPDLFYLAEQMRPQNPDLILVEGFKQEEIPKIQLFRKEAGHDLKDFTLDPLTIAVASDIELPHPGIPLLDLNNPPEIAQFILAYLSQPKS